MVIALIMSCYLSVNGAHHRSIGSQDSVLSMFGSFRDYFKHGLVHF